MNLKQTLMTAALSSAFLLHGQDSYLDFQPKNTSRVRENTEWTVTYAYDTLNQAKPRALLIGDSICNQYQSEVRKQLGKTAALTFWATSKCVTDPHYFKELDLILGADPYAVISLNNGLHSFTTNRQEWENAYRAAVRFIRAKCPNAKLMLTTCTPVSAPNLRKESVTEMNAIIAEIARQENLPVADLYAVIHPMNDSKWSDGVHFRPEAVKRMAAHMAEVLSENLKKGTK